MKIKSILLGGLIISSSSLFAIEGMMDIDPHNYSKQVFTLGLLPGSSKIKSNDKSYYRVGLDLHNKASLKELHYKKAEIFWQGGGGLFYYKGNGLEKQNVKFNIEFGLSSQISNIVSSVSVGGLYDYYSTTDNNNTTVSSGQVAPYIQGAIGTVFGKHEIGFIGTMYKYTKDYDGMNTLLNKPIKTEIKGVYTYRSSREIGVSFSPYYSIIKDSSSKDEKEIGLNIMFTWAYR